MKLIDRVAAGIDQLGKRAAQALDESKLRMEEAAVRRRKDLAARELGYLAYRKAKGEAIPDGEADVLVRRIGVAEEEMAKLEAEIAKLRGGTSPDGAAPSAPAEAPAAEAPPVEPTPGPTA